MNRYLLATILAVATQLSGFAYGQEPTNESSKGFSLEDILARNQAEIDKKRKKLREIQQANLLKKGADSGHVEAQYVLGVYYLNGYGVPENPEKASFWFRKAADQGHADAQNILGYLYGRGLGIPKDSERAAYWYQKAANQGSADAQYNLGRAYMIGEGVTENSKKAIRWFEEAANQGHAPAKKSLEIIYSERDGVP